MICTTRAAGTQIYSADVVSALPCFFFIFYILFFSSVDYWANLRVNRLEP